MPGLRRRKRSGPGPEQRRPVADPVFVLGNGPSLRGIDLERFSGVATVGMNAAYREWDRVGWYPTHYACLDEELIGTHHAAIRGLLDDGRIESAFLSGRILELQPDLAADDRCTFVESFRDIPRWRERREQHGLPYLEDEAFQTSAPAKLTTGAYAVRYAIHLGHRRIYLLGIDCNYVERLPAAREAGGTALEIEATPEHNPNYFFDDYQRAGDRYNVPNPEVHGGNLHLQAMEAVRDDIKAHDLEVEVRNCSAESMLAVEETFPFVELDRALGNPS